MVQNIDKATSTIAPEQSPIKLWKFLVVIGLFIVTLLLPASVFHLPGLTVTEQRTIAVFVFAAAMWITEALPSWVTSVVVIAILLLGCSTSSLSFMRGEGDGFGTLISYKSLMHTFADPVIILFLGGFVLAIGATKVGLNVKLSRILLKPFGTKTRFVLLGFLLVTSLFSMFMSDTATTAMMLSFLTPVLASLPEGSNERSAFTLAIPIAAIIGGIGTPIGTPPNAIAIKYLNEIGYNVSFGQWSSVMIPFVFVMIFISWRVLLLFFPIKQKNIEFSIAGEEKKGGSAIVVYITFAVTILLWLLDSATGVNSNTVAIIPIAVFAVSGVLSRNDLAKIEWSVLWMVAGGFALGVALDETGLAQRLINSIPFGEWSPIIVLIGSGLLCWGLSNFISNSGTAALMVPILTSVGRGMGASLDKIGGMDPLLAGIAICASLAMVLPISTPSNALAHATGFVKQKEMAKTGLTLGIIGMAIGFCVLIFIGL